MDRKTIFLYIISTFVSLLMAGCASMATPQGGPRDETPPRFVRAFPEPGAVNVQGRNMRIDFDEYITVKDAFTNVVVSPTSATQPRISGVGRSVNIQFTDSLRPNTTYAIDFSDAIQDNNEGNALQGFTYLFSTGPVLDTLRISGMVLDSRTLEPQQGILVGVHTSEADTAFSRIRFDRVAKTDDRGRFTLRGLAQGKYRLFALKDMNGDMRWDNPEENIAFYDEWIYPTAEASSVSDTIYNTLTMEVENVVEKYSTRFLPNNILLNSFSLGYRPQYLKSSQRVDSVRAVLIWNAPQDSLPSIRLVNDPQRPLTDWATTEIREGNDSVTLWLRDRNLISNDTLRLQVQYMRNIRRDSVELATDTLVLAWKRPRVKPVKQKKDTAPAVPLIEIKGGSQTQEYPEPYLVTFSTPLDTIYADRIRLEQKVDTLWIPVTRDAPLLSRGDSLNPRIYQVSGPWEYNTQYRLMLDSIAVVDQYGIHNKPTELNFKVRNIDDYGSITFNLSGLGGTPAFVDLLDASDKVVRSGVVRNGSVTFSFLQPATYYARVVFDTNGNGIYDTGDYDLRRQPEATAYFPKKITLRKNWDQNLSWDVNATPVDQQKPSGVKKNKPKTTRGQNNAAETEEEVDEPFDPSANPFDPNSRRNKTNNGRY